ncbi:OmpP1/FadL family transporter [Elongatibacter sediminis]|uniref:Outer membrane protein transport protein n=1 Tax=Elongatibacter sediminis TaxID=3119006 RepID=A0AAW9RKP1_9GAMM
MNRIYAVGLVVGMLVSFDAAATNGYFSHGWGTISMGMAGAGTAWSQDSLAAAANPAGMAFVGDRVDVGAEWFSPRREYAVEGGMTAPPPGTFFLEPGKVTSNAEHFIIPDFGYNRQISERHTVGLTIFANGGMRTDYPKSTFCPPCADGDTGVDLAQVFIAPTWTFRFAEDQALGVSPIIAWQRFEIENVGSFAPFSSDPQNLSDRGFDKSWGFGLQIGWQGALGAGVRGGISYRSKIYMQAFNRYRGLFAEQGDFDIPPMINAGLAWKFTPNQHLLLDIQHVAYSEIDAVGNPMLPHLQLARLGDDDGAGFGWDDVTTLKLGWQWDPNERHAWRAGVSYGEQPIPDSEVLFNILAPGVPEWHFTGGFTHRFERLELSGMVFYAPSKSVTGNNPLGPGQEITLRMYQVGASVSLGWKL